jgi:hypothetical protein
MNPDERLNSQTSDPKRILDTILSKLSYNVEAADALCTYYRGELPQNEDLKILQASIHDILTVERLPGPSYLHWLQHFHSKLKPALYLEIGVESGLSLQYAEDPTLAIGVDPEPHIIHPIKCYSKIVKSTSDKFFETFTGRVNLAFIDGLHYYDQVLRDFINVERVAEEGCVILFHDVYPVIPVTAKREWDCKYWAGDTWKVFPILQKYRPDLQIKTIPTFPTGLGVITNVNPHSQILINKFDDIIEEWKDKQFEDFQAVNLIANII